MGRRRGPLQTPCMPIQPRLAKYPYAYAIADDKYPLPLTVYRPVFEYIGARNVSAGNQLQFTVVASTPAPGAKLSYGVQPPRGGPVSMRDTNIFLNPCPRQPGKHIVTFTVEDGVMPEKTSVTITVLPAAKALKR